MSSRLRQDYKYPEIWIYNDKHYYKIIKQNKGYMDEYVILKKLTFGSIYLPVRTFKNVTLAIEGIYKEHNICRQCCHRLTRNQFGLYCPNEECPCL